LAGDRFDALMNYPLGQAILGFTAQGHLDEQAVRAQHEYGARTQVRNGAAFGDELERLMGHYDRSVTEVQLNLLDSHDSPRFRTMAGGDPAAYRLAVLLQATLPGAPCLYYGDEVGIEGHHDPDSRRGFPWDESRWDIEGLAWTRAVLAMRHELLALRRGAFRVAGAAGDAIAFVRGGDAAAADPVLVAVNAGDMPVRIGVHVPELADVAIESRRLPGGPGSHAVRLDQAGRAEIELSARAGSVFQRPG
jgi:neopullulanase